jgi:hypothetical protein
LKSPGLFASEEKAYDLRVFCEQEGPASGVGARLRQCGVVSVPGLLSLPSSSAASKSIIDACERQPALRALLAQPWRFAFVTAGVPALLFPESPEWPLPVSRGWDERASLAVVVRMKVEWRVADVPCFGLQASICLKSTQVALALYHEWSLAELHAHLRAVFCLLPGSHVS